MNVGAAYDEAMLAHLAEEGRLMLVAFARCDPRATVPGLDWDARTVLAHTGAVHRWAADVVRRRLATNQTGGSSAFLPHDFDGARLPEWFAAGIADLIEVLRSASRDLSCFTFVEGIEPRRFWIRRQAHETAIHRVDVEAAAAVAITPFDVAFAQDGLAELVGAFATEPAFASERNGRLLLDATDGPSWLVVFGGDRNVVTTGEPADLVADTVVRGTSGELYRWAWNRPVEVAVEGDPETIVSWRRVQVL